MFQHLGLFLRILRGILTEVRGEGKSLNRDEVEGGGGIFKQRQIRPAGLGANDFRR